MKKEFNFNKQFIDILINNIEELKLYSMYRLSNDIKYTIDYIFDIIIAISIKKNYNYMFPTDLNKFLANSNYSIYSKYSIKHIIRRQIIEANNNNNFLKKYIVIGNNYPVIIKDLTIII
jgi:hypothetical protein